MCRYVTLYKYLSVEKIDRFIDTINNHKLYLSDGKDFNDPFELSFFNRNNNTMEYINGLHILCLTNSYLNKLMWSHYANSHKGVCLTLRIPKRYTIYPIWYLSSRIYNDSDLNNLIRSSKRVVKRNVSCNLDNMTIEKKCASIKEMIWSYELEYRMIFDDNETNQLLVENNKYFFDDLK